MTIFEKYFRVEMGEENWRELAVFRVRILMSVKFKVYKITKDWVFFELGPHMIVKTCFFIPLQVMD